MEVGDVLDGRYAVKERLGSGGMGTVWRATDRGDRRRRVALKVLAEHLSQDSRQVERFRREAHILAKLDHPNIVPILGSGVDRGRHFIVMELVEGGSLLGLMRREGPLAADVTASVGVQACSALDYAHRRDVIHRDVKPANLMLVDGAPAVVKVTDFGIARLLDETAITATGSVLGSVLYMAPEQARGEEAGVAADVYALGAVLYECIAGRPPYEVSSLPELVAEQQKGPPVDLRDRVAGVGSAMSAAIMRALEPDPARRHPSAAELGRALVLTGEPAATIAMPTESPGPTTQPTAVRPAAGKGAGRTGALALVATLALAVLVGLFLAATGGDGEGEGSGAVVEDRPRPEAPADERAARAAPPAQEETQATSRSGVVIYPADRSRYAGGGYNAELVAVTRGPREFDVQLVARGATDLRRPESSCVEAGGQRIAPSATVLTAERPGFYAGTLSFPYGPSGTYRFRYSCQPDYSAPLLFERSEAEPPLRTIGGTVGTSVYGPEPRYHAIVGPVGVYASYFVVEFESSGYSDLRHPRESCVKHGGRTLRPLGLRLETEIDTRYRGEMTFAYEGPGLYEFLYSCQPDYSLVPLFTA